MCPLAAQPGRMPQVGYNICMEGSFFGAPDVSSCSTAGPRVGYDICRSDSFLGPLMCPLAAQPGPRLVTIFA